MTNQNEYRSILKGFYGALKSSDRYIQFAFLTGVTKFGKVSVFSDLNHLNDISMDSRYYDICGLTGISTSSSSSSTLLPRSLLSRSRIWDMLTNSRKTVGK